MGTLQFSCASVRPSVRKIAKFYRGAKAPASLGVSEVKERFRFRHDLLVILTFIVSEVKERFSGSPKRIFLALFSENDTLTVGDKTPESDHESSSWVHQDLDEFSVVFELTPCDVGSPRKGS